MGKGGTSSSVRAKGVTAMRLVHGRGDVGLEWTRWGRTEGVVAVGAAPELPWGDVARRDVRLSPHRARRECTIAYSVSSRNIVKSSHARRHLITCVVGPAAVHSADA